MMNNNIAFSFLSVENKYKPDLCNEWQLIYIYEGQGILNSRTSSEKCTSEQLILIRPNYEYELDVYPGLRLGVCFVKLNSEYMLMLSEHIKMIHGMSDYSFINLLNDHYVKYVRISDDIHKNLKRLIWCAAHEYGHFANGSGEIINNCILSAFIVFARTYEHNTNNSITTDAKNRDMNSLMMYIRSNFGSDLSLNILAEQAHLSSEYLCRAFKRHTGLTLSKFILDVRMNEAKQRLMSTSYSVYDISIYCGYNTLNAFERAFKKYTGSSPAAYRKEHTLKV